MNALDELIECISEFTPEQLDRFLRDPITVSILRLEEALAPCPPAAS